MKYYCKMMMAGLTALVLLATIPPSILAGEVAKIKEGTKEAVSEVRKEAVRAGKAAAKTGKEIKEGAVKAGAAVKESVKEVGREIKKTYQETKDAITEELSGNSRD